MNNQTIIAPLISVLMPAYNAEKYIGEAIESILSQSFSAIELIVIDDCSVDMTYEVAARYANKDRRVRLIKNSQNLGIAGNRNKAIGLVNTKYLAWQDADDVSMNNRLELQYEFLEKHPTVGIVGGGMEIFNHSKILGYRHYPQVDKVIREKIFRFSPIAQPAAMIRTDAIKEAGLYDLSLPPAEDLDMTFRIGSRYQLANLDEIVIRYRISDSSATSVSQRRIEKNTLRIRYKYMHSNLYKLDLSSIIFNLLHLISLWIIPARLKRWIFSKWRDSQ